MSVLTFSNLPDTARIWIYGAERPLTSEQIRALNNHMEAFLMEWQSHGREVTPSWQLLHDRFVVIGVDEAAVHLSGCSIDSMARSLGGFNRASGLNFSNSGGEVFYRDTAGKIDCVDRSAFRDMVKQGTVNEQTVVFNNTVTTVGEFRAGRWEVPMRNSWHSQVFSH